MIFKKKARSQQDFGEGLKDAPESLEYKKRIRDLDTDFNSDNDHFSDAKFKDDLPEIKHSHGLPPLKENELDMPPAEEKKRKIPKEKEIFVKMDNFRNIVQCIENMEQRLEQLEVLIQKLQKLNDNEVSEINSWKANLDELRTDIRDIADNLARE